MSRFILAISMIMAPQFSFAIESGSWTEIESFTDTANSPAALKAFQSIYPKLLGEYDISTLGYVTISSQILQYNGETVCTPDDPRLRILRNTYVEICTKGLDEDGQPILHCGVTVGGVLPNTDPCGS